MFSSFQYILLCETHLHKIVGVCSVRLLHNKINIDVLTNIISVRSGLLSTVHKRLAALGATRVFFASDAPTKNGTLRSHSYMTLKDPEKKMKMASDAAAHVLSNLEAVTWEMFDQTVLGIDVGIQGILDKILCMEAEAFIVAPDECIGKPSDFVISIVKAREEMGKVPGMETWAPTSHEQEN